MCNSVSPCQQILFCLTLLTKNSTKQIVFSMAKWSKLAQYTHSKLNEQPDYIHVWHLCVFARIVNLSEWMCQLFLFSSCCQLMCHEGHDCVLFRLRGFRKLFTCESTVCFNLFCIKTMLYMDFRFKEVEKKSEEKKWNTTHTHCTHTSFGMMC